MKFPRLSNTVAQLLTFLGIAELPIDAQKKQLNLSEDQEQKLTQAIGKEEVEKLKAAFNKEIEAISENNLDLKAIQDELAALVKEHDLDGKNLDALAENSEDPKATLAAIAEVKAVLKKQEETIAKLLKDGVGDVPQAIIKNAKEQVMHSSTHLFASGKEYDAFDRPWNSRALKASQGNIQVGATDFTDQPTVQKLNDDMKLYYRENPQELVSLIRDKAGLPSFWPTRTKVVDIIASGTIATAEITQARKLPWLPKNKQTIQPEEGRIFPIQLDAEFIGFHLQKLEASWLASMTNKEGSQPYKMSFVKYLVSELDKRARIEDRVATIKGIYVETPEDAVEAGRTVNRQDGILYLLHRARDVKKKYRPFDLGMPTAANIIDYVDRFIKSLPDEVRENQGLVLYLSDEWIRTYKRRYEELYGNNNDYAGYPENPKDYPNIKFQALQDMAGLDFMFMTFDDNIELLENVPAEKSMYKFETLKRMLYIMVDYKMGVRFVHIGNKVEAGDPDEFKVQTVWSNTAPMFKDDVFVPVHEDGTTGINMNYKNVYVTKNRTSTITEILNKVDYAGQVIKIKGNTGLAANLNVVHDNAKIKLAGNANFNLKSGGTLTLFVPADASVPFELSRTSAPATVEVEDINFTSGIIDANLGNVFRFTGGSTTAITSVLNGVPGKTITIYGTNTADVDVTFSTTGNILMSSSATLGAATHYVELTLVDGFWRDTKRVLS